jgi:hypothetical protein
MAAPDPVTDWMLEQPIWRLALGGFMSGALLIGGTVALLVWLGPGERTTSVNVYVPQGIVVTIQPARTAP